MERTVIFLNIFHSFGVKECKFVGDEKINE